KPCNLVVANIISSVLYFLADDLKRLSSKWLVLSGVLESESDVFMQKMDLNSCELIKKVQENEWVGFVFKRR
ncbi:MAG TPA: 50S ribosomal protein L11 methyltransferase, partial [bacterium]|nr:50S ribosomal protein L11 methyltransferase [bacterium]